MYYVYKIINNINNKFYIGKRKNKNPFTDSYMGSGKLITLAIEKYGKENFTKEIIAIFETNEEASTLERELVTKEIVFSELSYNMHEGGHGGFAHINSLPIEERINIVAFRKKLESGELKVGGRIGWTEEQNKRMNDLLSEKFKNDPKFKPWGQRWKEYTPTQKEARIKQISENVSGDKNYMRKTKNYINPITKEQKRYYPNSIPDGWILKCDYDEKRKENSRRWYNNGIIEYYIFSSDSRIEELNLVKGRIENSVRGLKQTSIDGERIICNTRGERRNLSETIIANNDNYLAAA